ncbi:hypothetical protein RRG08_063759 [Elysia crispata]|uniref:Uncharacterized protein n=1 Tax=Elysia crispata TaxID=231223 RepID=A0AAE1E148_9GAST|nr:hypothetical protein RRG08_063759 [Elysia crispata]
MLLSFLNPLPLTGAFMKSSLRLIKFYKTVLASIDRGSIVLKAERCVCTQQPAASTSSVWHSSPLPGLCGVDFLFLANPVLIVASIVTGIGSFSRPVPKPLIVASIVTGIGSFSRPVPKPLIVASIVTGIGSFSRPVPKPLIVASIVTGIGLFSRPVPKPLIVASIVTESVYSPDPSPSH